MEISVNDLVERVKINMEELTDVSNASVKLEVGIDVEQYIRAKLPDALLSVWASTPVELLPQTDCASSLQPERQPDGSGRVVLPSDVWRMTEFCMEGWRQPVTSFIDHTSPAYELQFNLYTRGGVATPVCVLSNVGGPACLNLLLQEGVRFEEGKAVPLGAGFVEVDKGGDVDLVASGPRLEIEMLAEASRRIHLVHAAVECRLLEQAGNEEVFPAGAVVAQQVEPRGLGDGNPRQVDGGKQLVEPAVQPRVLEPHDVQLAATLPAQGYGRVDCPHAIGQSAYGYEPYTLFFHRG